MEDYFVFTFCVVGVAIVTWYIYQLVTKVRLYYLDRDDR